MSTCMFLAPLGTSRTMLRGRRASRSATLRHPAASRATQPAVCFKQNDAAETVTVSFSLARKVPFGQQLVLVGDAPELGSWELGAAPLMSWSEGDVWHCTVELPVGAGVEYKFLQLIPNKPPVWESCMNRTQTIDHVTAELSCVWNAPLSTSWPALRGEKPAAASMSAERTARESEEAGTLTEEEAPAPAFKPATTFSQFADVVKKSAVAAAKKLQEAEAQAPTPAVAMAVMTAPAKPGATAPVEEKMPAAVASVKVAQAAPKPAAKPVAQTKTEPVVALASAPAAGSGSTLKSFGKAAGTVAMGVAATAMLSALAIDVTDAALLGAVAMGGIAAMSTPSPSSRKSSTKIATTSSSKAGLTKEGADAEEGTAATGEEEETVTIGSKASAPGVILAASVLSAFDAGKKILESGEEESK